MSKQKKVFFDVGQPYYLPQFKPVFDELDRRGVTCHFVFHKPRSGEDLAASTNAGVEALPKTRVDSAAEAAAIYRRERPDWVVFGHVFEAMNDMPDDVGRALVYHSIGPKAGRYNDSLNDMHVRFLESEHYFEQVQLRHPAARLILTGYAKLDPLFLSDSWSRDVYLDERGLDPGAKTLVYAPTYFPSSIELMPDDLPMRIGGCNLLVKPHYLTLSREKYKKQRAKFDRWRTHKNVHVADLDEYSLLPFMRAADMLMSEQSSALFEFCALDRPIVVCDFYKLRWGYRGFLGFRLRRRMDQTISQYRDIGVRVSAPRLLQAAIEDQLANPHTYSERRRECAKELVGATDGRASERIADWLLSHAVTDLT